MSKGKRTIPDYIPAGTGIPQSGDPSDMYASAVDNGQDFTANTTDSSQGPVDVSDQTGVSMPF